VNSVRIFGFCDFFFTFAWWGMESKLGPLGTSATEWPTVPAPGDYDDGEFGGIKIGRGNRVLGENLSQRHFVHHKSCLTRAGYEPGPPRWEATNCLSYGAANW
jgi:hypothetical protein